MNARLQVEHPVTELVTGLDLVELQLRVAAGEPLDVDSRRLNGHAIEARINAEDAQFFPSAGPVLLARYPDGVRVDAAVETGSVVGTDYDSMIAKVIAYGPDRATALARLDRALAHTAILGLTTNIGFLRSLLAREDVRAGEMDTGLIGRLDPVEPPLSDEQVARAYATHALGEPRRRRPVLPPRRLAPRRRCAPRPTGSSSVDGGEPLDIVLANLKRGLTALHCADGWLGYEGWAWHVTEATAEDVHHAHADGELRAPMPGSRAARAAARWATRSRRARRWSCWSR